LALKAKTDNSGGGYMRALLLALLVVFAFVPIQTVILVAPISGQVARISRSRLAPKSIAPRLGLLLYWRAFTVTRRTLFAPIVWILFIS
jgi:hypothetical protein